MDKQLTRRALLQGLVGGFSALGAVVLASAALSNQTEAAPPQGDVQDRADRLAPEADEAPDGYSPTAFLNRAFRNGGGFRNGGFRNAGFRNGAFRNGGFRNW